MQNSISAGATAPGVLRKVIYIPSTVSSLGVSLISIFGSAMVKVQAVVVFPRPEPSVPVNHFSSRLP
jgi:hypothetical protein